MIGMGEFGALFYICARDKFHLSTGYPPRSQIFDAIETFTCGADFLPYFGFCLELIRDHDEVIRISQLTSPPQFLKAFSLQLANPETDIHRKFWSDVAARVSALQSAPNAPVDERQSPESHEHFYKLAAATENDAEQSVVKKDGKVLNEIKMFPATVSQQLKFVMRRIEELAVSLTGFPNNQFTPAVPIIIVFYEARNLLKKKTEYLGSVLSSLSFPA